MHEAARAQLRSHAAAGRDGRGERTHIFLFVGDSILDRVPGTFSVFFGRFTLEIAHELRRHHAACAGRRLKDRPVTLGRPSTLGRDCPWGVLPSSPWPRMNSHVSWDAAIGGLRQILIH